MGALTGLLRNHNFLKLKLIFCLFSKFLDYIVIFALLLKYDETIYFIICFLALICSYLYNLNEAFSIIK